MAKRIGQSAGKNPEKSVSIALTGSKYKSGGAMARKYKSGGAMARKKKGGIVRKPKATIRYKRGAK